MAGIHIERLRKTFANHVAVDDLDLAIEDGELLVFLGPSGCGKTTTLNCIAGLEMPSAGRILFGEQEVTTLPPHQRNIAMVFQSSLLYPHLTARQNIAMSLKKSGLDRATVAERVEQAAAIVDIPHLLGKMPGHLSGGERQRVATAKAIVRQPVAFLMDEPLAALDAGLRLTLRAEIVNLQKRLSTTMVFVTHDQTEAMTMGDRIAVMQSGRIQQIGTPDEVYNDPRTLFVAGFVGAPPMNLFEGEVASGDGGAVFRAGELRVGLLGGAAPRRADGRVVLGVRPQHLRVRRDRVDGAMPVTVFALEHLGRESVLIMEQADGQRLRALVDAEFQTRVGDRLFAMPDAARGFLFDHASERRLRDDT